MFQLDNLWTESSITRKDSYQTVMHEIHVLLVDHDCNSRVTTGSLLELCNYRVTALKFASEAISMLTSGKVKFDIVMADMNSPDLKGYSLMQHAINMDLPIIQISVDDNASMAKTALENGAFLYTKKPVTIEIISCLWQHVFREKARMIRERGRLVASNYSLRGIKFNEAMRQEKDQDLNNNIANNKLMVKNKGKYKKRTRENNDVNSYDIDDLDNHMMINNNRVKRKVCTEWTQELHAKFMKVIQELGDGNCFPKQILDKMDVPGLTRMQVASHLQKCRNDNWRSPEDRNSNQMSSTSSDTSGPLSKPRRFGSMPRLDMGHSVYRESSGGVGQSSQPRAEVISPSNGGQENMGTTQIVKNNCFHPSDDFFNFPDMDCLINETFSSRAQGSGMMSNPNPNPNPHSGGPYHFIPVYPEQISYVPNMDTISKRSSETTNNIVGDESETRGNHE